MALRFHPLSVFLHDHGCHRKSKDCQGGKRPEQNITHCLLFFPFPVFAGGSSSAAWTCLSTLTGPRLQARINQSSCIARSRRAHRCAAISSKSISAMMGGPGLVHREKTRGSGGERRERVAELPRCKRIPRYAIPRVGTGATFHAKRDASLACDRRRCSTREVICFLLFHRLRPPGVGDQAFRASKVLSNTFECDRYSVFVLFKLTP